MSGSAETVTQPGPFIVVRCGRLVFEGELDDALIFRSKHGGLLAETSFSPDWDAGDPRHSAIDAALGRRFGGE